MNIVSPEARPRVALIAGPTASGKSALALALAEREQGTIINADASQVYRDLRILTARPSEAEEARAPHLLFGYRDGGEACSAAAWAIDARAAIDRALADGRLPILVGGTGLYLRTLLDGVAPVPPIEPVIRAEVRALDTPAAAQALATEDAVAAARLHPNDRSRIQRALEVVRSTGRSIGEWRRESVGGIRDRIAVDLILVMPPVAELYARCDARALAMIDQGALGEVAALIARRLDPALPVMRAIGVASLTAVLNGELDLAEAVAILQRQTRNYAKRQRTWFSHQTLGGMNDRLEPMTIANESLILKDNLS